MTTVLVHHRVADDNAWKPEFDRAIKADWSKGIRSHRVWRGQDDGNIVVVETTVDSRQAADAMLNDSALREAMRRQGGVVESSVRIDFLDEVA
jgi:hypothetical protein